ncbi:MAG: mitochondrial fission ELM1 family protein [Rhodospirillales bacterium]|nr:mitochondrial fission ELM1 family protein [Rhodospirillales bacterium]
MVGTPRIWAVHDGKVGIRSQVLGLAEALGRPFEEKVITLRFPWSRLPPVPWLEPAQALSPRGDRLAPPWPDLFIGCGRQSAVAALAVKRASAGATILAHVQDPRFARARFDLLVIPEHDRLRGRNVLVTRGAVHRVTPEKLRAGAAEWESRLAGVPRPRVAVLIGGNNKVFRLDLAALERIAEELAALARSGYGLLVTPSRRTGAEGERLLRERLSGLPAFIWDGNGDNPYFGFLALADAIVVTGDSVSMVSEAAATGKPVHVLHLPGGSAKFRRFHEGFERTGITRPFAGRIETWSYPTVNDTGRAAEAIERLLVARARRAA